MGFGRIGRNIFRILHGNPNLKITAIADIIPFETAGYLLRWDTVHGPFPDTVIVNHDRLLVGGREIKLINSEHPSQIKWSEHEVDIVIDATTRYRNKKDLDCHLQSGAKHVIVTVPPDDNESIDVVVLGVNEQVLEKQPAIISIGSITVNCLAPLLKILHEAYGVKRAAMTAVHAYTNAQRLADVPADGFRTSRSAAENIIPAPTSAAHVLAKVMPELGDRLQAVAMNVPIPDGSIIDLVAEFEKEVSAEQINQLIASAAGSRAYRNIIEYADDAIVSSDVIGNPHSAIFDSRSTRVLGGHLVKLLTWFDNGWGFASRAVELTQRIATWR
jgi:glyceraldehyde 3-phosphate dehydrogenase